jgi:hypothetical protein
MGAPGDDSDLFPPHEVKITKPFYIGITLITCEQYFAIMGREKFLEAYGSHPSEVSDADFNRVYYHYPHGPVHLDWGQAVEFCKVLSELTGNKVRVPTDAEWEYACRAGSKTVYFWGNNKRDGAPYTAGLNGPMSAEETLAAVDLCQRKPNPWGLYDLYLAGQMCSDYYNGEYWMNPTPRTDPKGPQSATRDWPGCHVGRGGDSSSRGAGPSDDPRAPKGSRPGLRIVVEEPFTAGPAEFAGVFKFSGTREGTYYDERALISTQTVAGAVALVSDAGGPEPLIIDRAAPKGVIAETHKPALPPRDGETVQLAIMEEPRPAAPAAPAVPLVGFIVKDNGKYPGGLRFGSGTGSKPSDPWDAISEVFKNAKAGEFLKIRYIRAATAVGGRVIAAEPYRVKPGEDQPGVYIFAKRTTQKIDNDLRQAIVVQKFEEESTFLVPDKTNADKSFGPDMDMLTFIDGLNAGDCVKLELSGKTVRAIQKYAPPAGGSPATK